MSLVEAAWSQGAGSNELTQVKRGWAAAPGAGSRDSAGWARLRRVIRAPGLVLVLIAAAVAVAAPPARAGETACWFDLGLVVAPAQVMGVAGDYIIDTATPQTALHDTAAQGAGFADTALVGEVRLAGLRLAGRPVKVEGLDRRARRSPTPIAGVIGADVLKAYVMDLSLAPCRLRLSRPGHAPRFRGGRNLAIAWIGGRPTIQAAVADGPRARAGDFALATGADAAIRLSDAAASAPGAAKPGELYPDGMLHPTLRALSFAGDLQENLASGLEADRGTLGVIGARAMARYRLRFDFPRSMLGVAASSSPRAKPD